jgi:hypothetical protein
MSTPPARALWLVAVGVAGAVACVGPAPTSLAVVHVEAVGSATCAGSPCDLPATGIREPHCGFDTTSLAVDAGSIHVVTGAPAQQLTGILDLSTRATSVGGTVSDSSNRRQLMADFTRVYPAFGGAGLALYDIDATGAIRPLGDAGIFDGGEVTFLYQPDFSDGGVVISEVHRVVLVEQRPVTVSDHSQDPFYGCCAHVDGLTLAPLFAFAALGLRRRRHFPAGVKTNG